MRAWLVGVCVVGAWVGAAGASAQESEEAAATASVENARLARQEFQAGVEHYQAGRYLEAIHSFQVAASRVPSADLWFNIATAYEQLARSRGEVSDYEQAIAHYRRYLTERVDPPDRAAVEANLIALNERLDAARAAQRVETSTATLRVQSSFEGASVRVDGAAVGVSPLDQSMALEPGHHSVEATREGYLPFLADVTLERGLSASTSFSLTPERIHRAITRDPVFAWIAWGLGAASVVGSVALGAHAQGLADQASRQPFDSTMPTDPFADARTMGAVSDALLGGAALLVAIGVSLYFLESSAVGTVTERAGVAE